MWICKKCKEENEDSFDTCYKCLTFSEEGAMKCNELPQKDDNKNDEKKFAESKSITLFPFVTILSFLISIFYPLNNNYSGTITGLEYNSINTFFASYSNTVKGWLPKEIDFRNSGYVENLGLHYHIKDSDIIFYFAAQLPYIFIILSVISVFWNKNNSKNK
jgi:hypothetical protein